MHQHQDQRLAFLFAQGPVDLPGASKLWMTRIVATPAAKSAWVALIPAEGLLVLKCDGRNYLRALGKRAMTRAAERFAF
jgi:hypothetical protein